MTYQFKDITATHQKSILDLIEKTDQKQKFNPNHTKIMAQDLPFAEGWQRLTCEDYSAVPYRKKDYLYNETDVYPCVYSADPFQNNHIEMMNVKITPDHAAFYLKFYSDYWIMGQDRLTPISYVDDVNWQDDISPNLKQSLNDELKTFPKIEKQENGIALTMMCVFRQSILTVSFDITPVGEVKTVKRDIMIEDLPIRNFS